MGVPPPLNPSAVADLRLIGSSARVLDNKYTLTVKPDKSLGIGAQSSIAKWVASSRWLTFAEVLMCHFPTLGLSKKKKVSWGSFAPPCCR